MTSEYSSAPAPSIFKPSVTETRLNIEQEQKGKWGVRIVLPYFDKKHPEFFVKKIVYKPGMSEAERKKLADKAVKIKIITKDDRTGIEKTELVDVNINSLAKRLNLSKKEIRDASLDQLDSLIKTRAFLSSDTFKKVVSFMAGKLKEIMAGEFVPLAESREKAEFYACIENGEIHIVQFDLTKTIAHSMSDVYKVRQATHPHFLILKVESVKEISRLSIHHEAHALALINPKGELSYILKPFRDLHKNPHKIISLQDGRVGLLNQFIHGQTLKDWANAHPIEERVKMAAKILDLVKKIEKLGIADTDFKLDNIMIDENGDLVLIDLDISFIDPAVQEKLDKTVWKGSVTSTVGIKIDKQNKALNHLKKIIKWADKHGDLLTKQAAQESFSRLATESMRFAAGAEIFRMITLRNIFTMDRSAKQVDYLTDEYLKQMTITHYSRLEHLQNNIPEISDEVVKLLLPDYDKEIAADVGNLKNLMIKRGQIKFISSNKSKIDRMLKEHEKEIHAHGGMKFIIKDPISKKEVGFLAYIVNGTIRYAMQSIRDISSIEIPPVFTLVKFHEDKEGKVTFENVKSEDPLAGLILEKNPAGQIMEKENLRKIIHAFFRRKVAEFDGTKPLDFSPEYTTKEQYEKISGLLQAKQKLGKETALEIDAAIEHALAEQEEHAIGVVLFKQYTGCNPLTLSNEKPLNFISFFDDERNEALDKFETLPTYSEDEFFLLQKLFMPNSLRMDFFINGCREIPELSQLAKDLFLEALNLEKAGIVQPNLIDENILIRFDLEGKPDVHIGIGSSKDGIGYVHKMEQLQHLPHVPPISALVFNPKYASKDLVKKLDNMRPELEEAEKDPGKADPGLLKSYQEITQAIMRQSLGFRLFELLTHGKTPDPAKREVNHEMLSDIEPKLAETVLDLISQPDKPLSSYTDLFNPQ
jgi:serine/threonine protein kinase